MQDKPAHRTICASFRSSRNANGASCIDEIFLTQAGFALAAGTIGSQRAWSAAVLASVPLSERPGWDAVRAQFALTDDFIHMAGTGIIAIRSGSATQLSTVSFRNLPVCFRPSAASLFQDALRQAPAS
jgi:hypothetical protein